MRAVRAVIIVLLAGGGFATYWLTSPDAAAPSALEGVVSSESPSTVTVSPPSTAASVDEAEFTLFDQAVDQRYVSFVLGGLPRGRDDLTILVNTAYVVGYDEKRKAPAWVVYRVPGDVQHTGYKRKSGFSRDTRTTSRITTRDYTHSGYSRGHMAPAYGVFSRFGKQAQHETHLMSNIAPQIQGMNNGDWKQIEQSVVGNVRGNNVDGGWAEDYAEVWVICGPIYDSNATYLGDSGRAAQIEIPDEYFKILIDVDEDTGNLRTLALIMSNNESETDGAAEDLTTIDAIEAKTGLDFLWAVRDDVEADIEDDRHSALWLSQ